MSKSNLAVFQFDNETPVRVTYINNEPWFVASDLCKGLDILDAAQAVRQIQKQLDDAKITGTFSKRVPVDTNGGKQVMVCVNDAGLNLLLMQSRKKEAMPFKWWIASEVLPTIRKTGSYNAKISLEQQQIKQAVNNLVNDTGRRYQDICREFYKKFCIPRYTELPAKDFIPAMRFLQAKPTNGNKFDAFLPIEIKLEEVDVKRLHALCVQVRMIKGWWFQYGDAIKMLNANLHDSMKHRIGEAWTCAEYFLAANNLPYPTDQYVINFPFGHEGLDQKYYIMTNNQEALS